MIRTISASTTFPPGPDAVATASPSSELSSSSLPSESSSSSLSAGKIGGGCAGCVREEPAVTREDDAACEAVKLRPRRLAARVVTGMALPELPMARLPKSEPGVVYLDMWEDGSRCRPEGGRLSLKTNTVLLVRSETEGRDALPHICCWTGSIRHTDTPSVRRRTGSAGVAGTLVTEGNTPPLTRSENNGFADLWICRHGICVGQRHKATPRRPRRSNNAECTVI